MGRRGGRIQTAEEAADSDDQAEVGRSRRGRGDAPVGAFRRRRGSRVRRTRRSRREVRVRRTRRTRSPSRGDLMAVGGLRAVKTGSAPERREGARAELGAEMAGCSEMPDRRRKGGGPLTELGEGVAPAKFLPRRGGHRGNLGFLRRSSAGGLGVVDVLAERKEGELRRADSGR
ncbi:putative basic proline-rich protein-like [Iris pallida]|uniref:Basic proline-rich protein-like n=1 Tax=Iris pallida TaxID=29817 RepID=A0AAX6EWF7_IRIPA|nr:putative basic proline-rich protein-like [Iris pallida]